MDPIVYAAKFMGNGYNWSLLYINGFALYEAVTETD